MASKSYSLLEYLVTLEKLIRELQDRVDNGNIGGGIIDGETGNVDLSPLINQINNVQQELDTFKISITDTVNNNYSTLNSQITSVNSALNTFKTSITNTVNSNKTDLQVKIDNLKTKIKEITRTDYIYVGKDSNNYSLYADSEIKVYDEFNNFLLKENENYKRSGTTLTFNYINPLKLRIEYYERVIE